jgi:hypothetical protein
MEAEAISSVEREKRHLEGVWSALMEAEAIVARARDIGMNLVA